MKIIGYTYEADFHCVGCAQKREAATGFPVRRDDMERSGGLRKDEHGLPIFGLDRENNPIHPIFSTDEQLTPLSCGDCGGVM